MTFTENTWFFFFATFGFMQSYPVPEVLGQYRRGPRPS